MSLKHANRTLMGWREGIIGVRAWSITRRLILLYTLSACVTLVLAAGFLYWALARNVAQEGHQFLIDKINVLRLIVQERANDPEAFVEELEWEGKARQLAKYYARILDTKRRTLFETHGMRDIVETSVFPVPIGLGEAPQQGVKWRSHHHTHYLLIAAWAEAKHTAEGKQLIQVALDVSHAEALLANYRRTLVVVLLVALFCSAALGIAITRKGLRPLLSITAATQQITATDLHTRLTTAHWPQELTALATAFDDMLNRLEDSFIRLSQFSADLAHELRTPINNLMGETDVALSRHRTPEEYRQVLESNLEEYARLSRMIENLLFLARAESPQTHIECSQFDARKALDAVREFHEAMAEEYGVNVICQGQAFAYAEPMLFRRAVSNVLSNALQHTPRGGKIILDTQPTEDQGIVVSIRDTGCGIASEHLPKLFDRLYQVDPARTHSPSGTGLGLAIVKSIMDLHRGMVTIDSELTKGTTLILRFPPPP